MWSLAAGVNRDQEEELATLSARVEDSAEEVQKLKRENSQVHSDLRGVCV